jgi:hypothetical protein
MWTAGSVLRNALDVGLIRACVADAASPLGDRRQRFSAAEEQFVGIAVPNGDTVAAGYGGTYQK